MKTGTAVAAAVGTTPKSVDADGIREMRMTEREAESERQRLGVLRREMMPIAEPLEDPMTQAVGLDENGRFRSRTWSGEKTLHDAPSAADTALSLLGSMSCFAGVPIRTDADRPHMRFLTWRVKLESRTDPEYDRHPAFREALQGTLFRGETRSGKLGTTYSFEKPPGHRASGQTKT